jgi:hypothetical protein
MIRTDITCRAVPWSRLIHGAPNASADLNLQPAQKASVALIGIACALLIMAMAWPQALALSALALGGVVFLNRKLYAFFGRQHGILFAAACVPLHLLYFLYSGLSYFYIWTRLRLRRLRSRLSLSTASQPDESLRG